MLVGVYSRLGELLHPTGLALIRSWALNRISTYVYNVLGWVYIQQKYFGANGIHINQNK